MDDSNCEQGMVLMSLSENSAGSCSLPLVNNDINDAAVAGGTNAQENVDKSDMWMASSPVPALNPISSSVDQPTSLVNSPATKVIYN